MLNPSDFASVQYGRKMNALAQQFAGVSPDDLRRAILYRHHLSALRLQFAPLGRRPVSGLRR